MKARLLYLLVFCFSTSIPTHKVNAESVTEFPIESYIIEDTSDFNTQLLAELSNLDTNAWEAKPLAITLKYLNGASFGRFGQITREAPEGDDSEYPDTIIMTVIQDGYRNDSVRGEWVELTFKRDREGIWLIEEVKRAFLCWRGKNKDVFQKDFCP